MNIKSLLLFFTAIVISCTAYSQVPGYMGKRLSVEYKPNFFPAILNLNPNMQTGVTSLNVRHNFNLDYILGPGFSLGGTYSILNTGMTAGENTLIYTAPGRGEDFYAMQLKGQGFGMYAKFFKHRQKGAIAPYGDYTKLNVSIFQYQVLDKEGDLVGQDKEVMNFQDLAIGYTLGTQAIWFDKLVVDIGLQFGFRINLNSEPGLYFNGNKDIQETLTKRAGEEMASYYFTNINLGVGYLLF